MDYRAAAEFEDVRRRMAAMWEAATAEIITEHEQCQARQCRLAGAATSVVLLIGGTDDVMITWSTPMPADEYDVDLIPMGLVGKAGLAVISQDTAAATVRVTATVLLAAGTQFLAHARS